MTWLAKVTLSDMSERVFVSEWQRLDSRVSANGDLSIVRTHPDMYAEPVIASYAAGYWHAVVIDQEDIEK